MKRLALALLPAVLVALAPAAPATAGPSRAPDRSGAPLLLAVGDSVPAGFGVAPGSSYPEQLAGLLSSGYNPSAGKARRGKRSTFELANLAVSGATTTTLVRDQLRPAVELIERRRADRDRKNDVEVVTVTIGGNDVFGPATTTCLLPAGAPFCQGQITAALAVARANLATTLVALTRAAGRRTEVVVTTYYDPIPSCPLATAAPVSVALSDVVLWGGSVPGLLTLEDGLNDVIEQTAAATGAQVAGLYDELLPGQLIGDCLHPNAEGHREIARLVYDQLAD